MADSEEFRLKRIKHEEHMSRVFDEVMGLGDFADSSRGSATSCKSGGQDDTKGADKTLEEQEKQLVEEDDSSGSKQEEKQSEAMEKSNFPGGVSPPTSHRSSFNVASTEGGGGGSGSAAFDDAQDGLPRFGQEEEEEDWHFALPLGSLEDVDVGKANQKKGTNGRPTSSTPGETCDRVAKEEEEEQDKEGSSGSANTSHSSRDHTPDNSQDGGALNQTEETEDSQQGESNEAAPVEDSNPPTSPLAKIKEEPIDEGYDAALVPQTSTKQIKEELEQEELKISSVYSVGGGSTFGPPTIPTPVGPTAIFIPGRGTVLQAMAPLAVRPSAPLTASLPTLTTAPPRPAPPPVPGSVRCSGCSKVLLKGQTAFQRKGSTQLFCSTVCLTGHLPPPAKNRICIQCNREILQPRDMVTVPGDDNNPMHFCGQFCLQVYRHKKKTSDKPPDKRVEKRPEKKPEKPPEKPVERQPEKPFCAVCRATKRIEHEVTHQGRLHRLCSNACFATWRMMRQLAMNCCEGCGLYCNSNSGSCQTLTIDKSQLNFCGPTCISTYRLTCKKTVECANCRKMVVVSATIIERDSKGKIQLYCSSACVGQSRPPRHVLTDTAFPCCLCKVSAVPQYHLAMVDGTIRNFCSLACVTIYRKCGHNSQPDLANGTSSVSDPTARDSSKAGSSAGVSSVPQDASSVPYHHPSHTSVPPLVPPATSSPGQPHAQTSPNQLAKPATEAPGDASRVTCHQCSKLFSTKPLLFSQQGRISMFCSKLCSEQFKTQKNILAVCESCKQEKVHFETISYEQQDKVFCSDGCKIVFKHGLTSRQKDQTWRPCSYCAGISQKMLHSHYGGKMKEFCRPHCMSQYTVLYYGMGRCDSCRKQGHLTEKLQCLGSVRNFCNMSCLLHYCHFHFETSANSNSNGTGAAPQAPFAPTQPHHSSKMNPVIADVVSLANGSATQPCVSADTALTGALPTSSLDGKNLDHASTQTDAVRLPMPRRRQMKNKSVLCRPFTMDQESMCQLPASLTQSGGEQNVKMMMVPVPVPVPVYIPVPMNMYSQNTPVTMPVPFPIPVPLVMTPQKEMKDAAVQSENTDVVEEKQKDGTGPCPDQSGTDTVHLQSQCVAPTVSAHDETQKAVQADQSVPGSSENTPDPDTSQATSAPSATSPIAQPPSSPVMDLERDFPTESLVQKVSPPKRGVKRPREGSSSRKRGRRRTASLEPSTVTSPPVPKLNHMYGVKAWKNWAQQHNKQPHSACPVDISEDVFQCSSTELSFALSHFIREVRRPNGETYSPDSIFYLCLGIQQYLFMEGRIENIFTDELYSPFSSEITAMLRLWKPKLLPSGCVAPSRVEESYLWECKQLGAYSPIVLLNTVLFFCTKSFNLTTLAEHKRLFFSDLVRCSKPSSRSGKIHYICYQRSSEAPQGSGKTEQLRKKPRGNNNDLEMAANVTNALHCPVRLYEFYLSRCPESVKKRGDLFYLQPERNVHTQSPHWYTCQPLDDNTLQSMLTRILVVREVQQKHQSSACGESDGSL